MLGFAALGQVSQPAFVIVGVACTGTVGTFTPAPGGNPVGVFGTGLPGVIITNSLTPKPRQALVNAVRRTRTLGRLVPNPTI
jgi:hypothetical protein